MGQQIVSNTPERPAFYAVGRGTGGVGDWVTLLHPPYTLWHLSYVVMGAAVMPPLVVWRLAGTLVAFFLAVGIGAPKPAGFSPVSRRGPRRDAAAARLPTASALAVGRSGQD